MVNFDDAISQLSGYGQAKGLFILIILFIIGAIFLLYQQREERVTWKLIAALVLLGISGIIANYLFVTRTQPLQDFTVKDIWLGNESENVTQKDYDRLQYLQDNLVLSKRSFCDTPSRFDYSDDGSPDYLDDAGDYYKKNPIEPQWDVHIYTYGEMRIFKIILFYANQKNIKHDLDFEYIQMYYRVSNENLTGYEVPDYVSFPTYEKFIAHPRIFLTWDQMPVLYGDVKCLAIDPDTNAFASDYNEFPVLKDNYQLSWVAPEQSEYLDYLTETEQVQLVVGFSLCIFSVVVIVIKRPDRMFLWVYLAIMFFAIGIYPLLALRYDFVVSPTFRIWTEDTPEEDAFVNSNSGRFYMKEYNLPWNRSSWSEPDNEEICL